MDAQAQSTAKQIEAFMKEGREEMDQRVAEAARDAEKTPDLAEPTWEQLREKYRKQMDGHAYIKEAFDEVGNAKTDVHQAARAFGIPAIAIAGAIVDERSTSVWAKKGFDTVQEQWAHLFMALPTVRKEYEANQMDYTSASKQDIGPGNFKVRTGLELFEKYVVQDKQDNPIKSYLHKFIKEDASDSRKWEAYKKHLMLTPAGTAWLAAAEMARGREELAPYMQGLSEKEQAAVLMTWYKQGPKYLERHKRHRETTGSTAPIKPGEGVGIFRDHENFSKILK